MTTSRFLTSLALAALAVGAWSQTSAPATGATTSAPTSASAPAASTTVPTAPTTPAGSSPAATPSDVSTSPFPQELKWALAEFQGEGDWTSRLPRLLIRGWDELPEHQLTEAETAVLRAKEKDDALRSLDQQETTLKVALDKKRLLGPLASTEPAATEKSLADLESKAARIRDGKEASDPPPVTLPLRSAWAKGQENRPWFAVDSHDLITKSGSVYAVTGAVRSVGGYLDVSVELYSNWEKRVLSDWTGHFAPEEAAEKMAEVSDQFHEFLLGRSWAGLSVTSTVSGTTVKVDNAWHQLPWWTDDLEPGTFELTVQKPGRPKEKLEVTLEGGHMTPLNLTEGSVSADKLVLETDPPGVSLFLDSQYLGPSPQTIDRPFTIARVRAQGKGWATLTWEVGPKTPSPSQRTLSPPAPLPSIPDAKDKFYFSLALFSFSLTSSAFLGAWTTEQVLLTNSYALSGSQTGYDSAYSRYQLVHGAYVGSVVLTTGLFVWMMFQLGDYLGAAQANLP